MNAVCLLVAKRDDKLKEFNERLLPKNSYPVLGVGTKDVRKIAKAVVAAGDGDVFLAERHTYLEEYLLCDFIIAETKDYGECLKKVNAVLPFLNNWMLTDALSPKAFFRKPELLNEIAVWIRSGETFTIRFGIVMLIKHFTDGPSFFDALSLAASVKSDEYYVQTAQAWFFATALSKRYDDALRFIEGGGLSGPILKRTVAKARESLAIDKERKKHLSSLVKSP